jgi:hypothetical protein
MDIVAYQTRVNVAEIALVLQPVNSVRAARAIRRLRQLAPQFGGRSGACIVRYGDRFVSAHNAAAATPSGTIAGIRLETIRSIRRPFDTDYRKDDDGRRLTRGIDISAAAYGACAIGKLDNVAHCNPLFRPGTKDIVGLAGLAPLGTIKALQG